MSRHTRRIAAFRQPRPSAVIPLYMGFVPNEAAHFALIKCHVQWGPSTARYDRATCSFHDCIGLRAASRGGPAARGRKRAGGT